MTRLRDFLYSRGPERGIETSQSELVSAVWNSAINAGKEFGFPGTWLGPAPAGFSEAEDSSLIYPPFVRFTKSK